MQIPVASVVRRKFGSFQCDLCYRTREFLNHFNVRSKVIPIQVQVQAHRE